MDNESQVHTAGLTPSEKQIAEMREALELSTGYITYFINHCDNASLLKQAADDLVKIDKAARL